MTILDTVTTATDAAIALDDRYVAHNYSPLPVVAASAEGAWITDVGAAAIWTVWPPIRRSTSGTATRRSSPPRTRSWTR